MEKDQLEHGAEEDFDLDESQALSDPDEYPIPEEDVDLDAELAAESAEAESAEAEEQENLPAWAKTKVVQVYGRDFPIGEPGIGITLRILRIIGVLAVRGNKAALRSLQSLVDQGRPAPEVSWRAHLFGILASIYEQDLIALGSAVLQFENDRDGRKFLNNPPEGFKLVLSPIIRAFWLNIAQSEDLRDALNDFFVGMGMTSNLLETLTGLGQ